MLQLNPLEQGQLPAVIQYKLNLICKALRKTAEKLRQSEGVNDATRRVIAYITLPMPTDEEKILSDDMEKQ